MISEADPELASAIRAASFRMKSTSCSISSRSAGAKVRVAAAAARRHRRGPRGGRAACPSEPIVLHLGQRWFTGGSTLREHPAPRRASCAQLARRRASAVRAGMRGRRRRPSRRPGATWSAMRSCRSTNGRRVFERASCHRDGRYRCDTCRKRGAQAHARRLRTPLLPAELAGVGALRRPARAGSQAGGPKTTPSLAQFRGEIVAGVARLDACLRFPSSFRRTTGCDTLAARYSDAARAGSAARASSSCSSATRTRPTAPPSFLRACAPTHPNVRHLPGAYSGRAAGAQRRHRAARAARSCCSTTRTFFASPDLLSRHLQPSSRREQASPWSGWRCR